MDNKKNAPAPVCCEDLRELIEIFTRLDTKHRHRALGTLEHALKHQSEGERPGRYDIRDFYTMDPERIRAILEICFDSARPATLDSVRPAVVEYLKMKRTWGESILFDGMALFIAGYFIGCGFVREDDVKGVKNDD